MAENTPTVIQEHAGPADHPLTTRAQEGEPPSQGAQAPSQEKNHTSDIDGEKPPSEAFAQAVVATVAEDIHHLEDLLLKIKEEQESLLKEVAEIAASMETGNVLEDPQLKQTMMQLPFYTLKLQIVRKEMVTLVEKSRKMRERAGKLEERHKAQLLAAEQKRAKELALQKQLLAQPASHLVQKEGKK
eukprot:comp12144_c0_seq1/m.6892 comp12144_c0_seq1/g.6892  ORF comp12144_c0_seq1/g.6892 comp12144_c0_seq1/m.6892 type:complete len:187 (-) comp12144_c0_seq1:180-740(-)